MGVAAGLLLWNYIRTKKTMDTIEEMLHTAVYGDFLEEHFDESRMSALETKFAHYLSASAVSARNVKEEKDKIKELVSDISHQTKTPIANLMMYCELLGEEDLPESARENVDALRSQTEKLRFLMDALVKLSRLENGIVKLSPRTEKLEPVLAEVYEQFSPKAEEKGLAFSWEHTNAFARFDPKWTVEAIGNIVDNAIKYTGQGHVAMAVVKNELFIRIDISDTGNGIPEGEQAKIFSRFYRSETARDEDGVGIGLYLARMIISGQGGYIKVSSKETQGSVFSVFLPR